jgi:hypothetical protein
VPLRGSLRSIKLQLYDFLEYKALALLKFCKPISRHRIREGLHSNYLIFTAMIGRVIL